MKAVSAKLKAAAATLNGLFDRLTDPVCLIAGASCFLLGSSLPADWNGNGTSEGTIYPDERYELRTDISVGSGSRLPLLVDSRTGDTWLFLPRIGNNEGGWQYYAPPGRPRN